MNFSLVTKGALCLFPLILAGCSDSPSPLRPPPGTVETAGVVVATNGVAANANKSQVLRVRDGRGNITRIVLPVGKHQGLVRGAVAKLHVGDKVEATGELNKTGDVVCYKAGHRFGTLPKDWPVG